VLGIFAAHAQKIGEGKPDSLEHDEGGTGTRASFVQSLVPFYVGCLIEVRSSFLLFFLPYIFFVVVG
jgi:hypothetical protein